MKIALIIEHFDPARGGAEHFTFWLTVELAKRGHDVHVICHDVAAKVNKYRQATQRASHDADRSHQAFPGEEVLPEGVHIHRLKGMKLNSGFGFRRFGARAQVWCRENKPDLVHSMSIAFPGDLYQPHAGIYAEIQAQAVASRSTGAAARFKRLMLKLSSKQRTLIALERRAFGGKAHVLSLCPMLTRQIQNHYATPLARITELVNPRMAAAGALDPAVVAGNRKWFREHYKLKVEDRVALFVGHDFRRKGLRYAIEAIAKSSDWRLLVVGLGKAREYVDLANGMGIGDLSAEPRVLFVGPTREMDRLYPAADALLLPTFYDSFGLVVLEAFAHGLPVVSTQFLGAAYLIEQAKAGVIVGTPKETGEMARALEGLPGYGSEGQMQMAERARVASAGMLPDDYLGRLMGLYEELSKG